jgi:putative tricarboxylic transport membrane protein
MTLATMLAWPGRIGALVLALGLPFAADAQTMREPKASSIEVVVGSQAGATPDIFMRKIAKVLADEKLVTLPMVVTPRPGGAWTTASNYVIGKKGEENVLFSIVPTVFTTPISQGRTNVFDQLTPLAMLMRIELLVLVRPESPWKTLKDLVEAGKKAERSVKIAGANVGSTDHIVTSLIEKAGGIKINFVPFDGGGGAINTAFLGGVVDAIVASVDESESLIRGGKARALGILSDARRTSPELFKDIATAKETGVDVQWGQYYGIAAPPGLDPAVQAWWIDKLTKMNASAAWKKTLDEAAQKEDFSAGDKAKENMAAAYQRFKQVLADVGLSKQK